jgi:hypothetical protein
MEETMGVDQAPTAKGKEVAKGLRQAAQRDERKTEAETGHPLKKGADRFEERSRSSDGKGAGAKQKG